MTDNHQGPRYHVGTILDKGAQLIICAKPFEHDSEEEKCVSTEHYCVDEYGHATPKTI